MNSRPLVKSLILGAALAAVSLAFAADTHTKGEKPAHIAMGQKVALADYLVPGKTTVFDFTSEFCPPCRAIAPMMEKVHATRADIAVVKVDINRPGFKGIDFYSPVARQYRLESIPHFKVFGPDGKLRAEGVEARKIVIDWFQ